MWFWVSSSMDWKIISTIKGDYRVKIITKQQALHMAYKLAEMAHKNQVDKAGKEYIGHLSRVVDNCKSHDAKVVAWLHDIVEDGHLDMWDLRHMGLLTNKQREALRCVTKDPNTSTLNSDYYERIKNNPIAREVKLADLKDNMDMSRFAEAGIELTKKHWEKYAFYKKWNEYLLAR